MLQNVLSGLIQRNVFSDTNDRDILELFSSPRSQLEPVYQAGQWSWSMTLTSSFLQLMETEVTARHMVPIISGRDLNLSKDWNRTKSKKSILIRFPVIEAQPILP